MKSKLENLVIETQKQKGYLKTDLDTIPTNMLNMHRDRRALAPYRIEDLKREYVAEFSKSVALILVTGELSEEFSKQMSEDTGAEIASFDTLINNTIDRMGPHYLKNRTNNSTLVSLLAYALREELEKTNIDSYIQLIYTDKYQGFSSNRADIESLFRKLANDFLGFETQLGYLISSIAEKAFNEGFYQKNYPVVVNCDIKYIGAIKETANKLNIKAIQVLASELADENEEGNQKNGIYISELKQKKITETYKKIKKLLN